MARPPRIQLAGAAYHVTARGVARQPIFCDDTDRLAFLMKVAEVVQRLGWACHAYCLMTTHYHLLVRPPRGDLAVGMQRLNGHYAQGFNRRHGFAGHVFESRYHSALIERDAHLLELSRYFALNPVRARLCRRPVDWRWGSYRAALGVDEPRSFLTVEWLLAYFGTDRARARDRLRAFVEDAGDTLLLRGLTP